MAARNAQKPRAHGAAWFHIWTRLATSANNKILECADSTTPARLPRRGPRLSALWSRATRRAHFIFGVNPDVKRAASRRRQRKRRQVGALQGEAPALGFNAELKEVRRGGRMRSKHQPSVSRTPTF